MPVCRIATFGTSLTQGGGWQAPLIAGLAGGNYLPGVTYEITNRGISGANATRIFRNAARVVADDPSVVIIDAGMNDSIYPTRYTPLQFKANVSSLIKLLRASLVNVKIVLQTAIDPRYPNKTVVNSVHHYYDMLRYLGATDAEPYDKVPDWLFDGTAFWAQLLNTGAPDGVHAPPATWNTYITPYMVRGLGAKLVQWNAAGGLRYPVSPTPPAAWTPIA